MESIHLTQSTQGQGGRRQNEAKRSERDQRGETTKHEYPTAQAKHWYDNQ